MSKQGERGKGQFELIIGLAVLGAVCYAFYSAGPVYWADWQLEDRMKSASLTAPNPAGDKQSMERLMDAVEDLELEEYLGPQEFSVILAGGRRTISCAYEREVTYLPGVVRTVSFEHSIEQPVF
jgi:hypothetical protein